MGKLMSELLDVAPTYGALDPSVIATAPKVATKRTKRRGGKGGRPHKHRRARLCRGGSRKGRRKDKGERLGDAIYTA